MLAGGGVGEFSRIFCILLRVGASWSARAAEGLVGRASSESESESLSESESDEDEDEDESEDDPEDDEEDDAPLPVFRMTDGPGWLSSESESEPESDEME